MDCRVSICRTYRHDLAPYQNPHPCEGSLTTCRQFAALPDQLELSAPGLASVVPCLAIACRSAAHAAVGYGEFRPLRQHTAAGRRANRRVVLLISRYLDSRHEAFKMDQGEDVRTGCVEARKQVWAPPSAEFFFFFFLKCSVVA